MAEQKARAVAGRAPLFAAMVRRIRRRKRVHMLHRAIIGALCATFVVSDLTAASEIQKASFAALLARRKIVADQPPEEPTVPDYNPTAFPFTPPTGMTVYGTGTPVALTQPSRVASGTTHMVSNKAEFDAAYAAYESGDIIVLEYGGTFTGTSEQGITLTVKPTAVEQVVIMAEAYWDGTLHAVRPDLPNPEGWWETEGVWVEPSASSRSTSRLRPADATTFDIPYIQPSATWAATALQTALSSAWTGELHMPKIWIGGVGIRPNPAADNTSAEQQVLIMLGGRDQAQDVQDGKLCPEFVLDRCLLTNGPTQNLRRAIQMHGRRVAIINSCFDEMHSRNNDAGAVGAWIGGPYKLVNNTMRCMGVGLIFGGADPWYDEIYNTGVEGTLDPRDCLQKWNHIYTPLEWIGTYSETSSPGTAENVGTVYEGIEYRHKNLDEKKNCIRWWTEGNIYENNTARGQSGPWAVYQSVTDGGNNVYASVNDGALRYNIVRRTQSGIAININLTGSHYLNNASNTTPIVITASTHLGVTTEHAMQTGFQVAIQNVEGNTAANGVWTVTRINSTTFSLDGSAGNGAYTSGGRWVGHPVIPSRIEINENYYDGLTDEEWLGPAGTIHNFKLFNCTDIHIRKFTAYSRLPLRNGGGFLTMNATLGYPIANLVIEDVVAPFGTVGIEGEHSGGVSRGNAAITNCTSDTTLARLHWYGTDPELYYNEGAAYAGMDHTMEDSVTAYLTDPENDDLTLLPAFAGEGADIATINARCAGVEFVP